MEKADFYIGGVWGNCIAWSNPEEFQNPHQTFFTCYGFKGVQPIVGDTLVGEFIKSIILFRFISVTPCKDPIDMFFAKVEPIKQVSKTDGAITWIRG